MQESGAQSQDVVTPDNEPFIDLVQIRAEGAFGTGLLVGAGLVLTALHCVADPDRGWRIRANIGVYLLRDLQLDKEIHRDAEIVWPRFDAGIVENPPDVAILNITEADVPVALVQHRFGEVPRVPTLGSARGFPAAAAGRLLPGGRIEHDQPGRVHYTSLTRRALTIDATGSHDLHGKERWKGLSGGPLSVGGLIVGVMREVPEGWRGEAVEAEPLAPLLRGGAHDDLRALLGIRLPLRDPSDPVQAGMLSAYAVIGTEAAAASERVFAEELEKPLYGRAGDLAVLDNTLVQHDRGVLLLRGDAGLGKSRLLAEWAERCAAVPGTTVLRHAFSVRETAGGSRNAMVANLVRQAADLLGPEALGPGEPGDAYRLNDRLARLLSTNDRPADSKLLVLLDGLDEAAERIEPWSAPLGSGVFVAATCRAERDEEPRTLRLWRERANDAQWLALDHTLPALDAAAVAVWLTAVTGRLVVGTHPVVDRAIRASEGLPLFLSLIIHDVIAAVQLGVRDSLPASFGEYARQRLTELEDHLANASVGGGWSWNQMLDLFATLTVLKGPVPVTGLRDLIGPQRLASLDQRVERWLWHRKSGLGFISFAHPRLAAVFRGVLPDFQVDVGDAERRVTEVCGTVWNSSKSALRDYSLTFLPVHLVGLGRMQEAAGLLANVVFLLARFGASPTSATVHATASETIRVDRQLAGKHSQLAEWRRFWVETESATAAAVEHASVLGLTVGEALVQLLQGRFESDSAVSYSLLQVGVARPSVLLMRPCGFRHPALLRSIDDAHRGSIIGVLALDDALVSWGGEDGALRFWSRDGSPRAGGDPKAHGGWVRGVLALDDGLVSWGDDGALRFWNRDGAPRSGGDPEAHDGGVEGVLPFDDGLVSWGDYGSLRFWSCDGAPRPGGDPKAHDGGVKGVLPFDDGLVSWGDDGALRFWSCDGTPRSGGNSKAHRGIIRGVIALDDALVSWGGDGALRFWNLDGASRLGGDLEAHRNGVTGLLALDDALVSGGEDGALRFWSRDGAPRSGGGPKAHHGWPGVEGMLALEDALVSWGTDGALRFWSHDGTPQPGGDPEAHGGRSGVGGILALKDALVSWGADGALRFWSHDGTPQPGGDPRAHRGRSGVGGVLALEDALVSWCNDGALRFWSREGPAGLGGNPEAHDGEIGGVLPLDDGLVSWGKDGTLRFWNRDGTPRSGGNSEAHRGIIRGVIALDNALVSWGGDGALRFWNLDGASRPGGDPKAHRNGVTGLLALDDALVSWGGDGALRFWSHDGAPRPGGDPDAYPGGAGGAIALDNALVSWGSNGALRFWSLDGAPQAPGPRTPRGNMDGMLALDDALVSWRWDGTLRFWSRDGAPRPGGNSEAHNGRIMGVLALDNAVVSWGKDGALRFWSCDGTPRPGGDPAAHRGSVMGVLALDDALVSWGEDGTLRFWSHDGAPRPGCAWLSPAPIECVSNDSGTIWVGMMGRPHRLVWERDRGGSHAASAHTGDPTPPA